MRSQLVLPLGPGSWVIGECGVQAYEDIVLNPKAVTELDATPDRHPVADHDVILDEDVIAKADILAKYRAWKYVGKRSNARTAANVDGFDDRLWMVKWSRCMSDAGHHR
jgi:hypothetical protein